MARTSAVRITGIPKPATLWSRLQGVLAPAYRLERELGGGGMSRVFLATRSDSRLVVVKVLADCAADVLELRRFRQEVAITTALRHPHVLPVLASGEDGGLAWFVTPFVAEGSLRDLLHRERRLASAHAVRLLGDVADALAYAHACGVVHGDLKPENVLLANGRALLADFGGARLRFLRRAAGGEPHAQVIGTPLYMSPEQAAGESTFDGRADLYSLGVVGWELLTGRPPFTGTDARSVLLAHLGAPVPSLRAHRDDVPARLANLVERMLAKDPDARPRSAFVVRTALDVALDRPVTGRPIGRPRHTVHRTAAQRTTRPPATTALTRAAAALLATAVTGGALAAAAGLLPAVEGPAPSQLAHSAPAVYEEPGQLPRLQELDPLVIRGRGLPSAPATRNDASTASAEIALAVADSAAAAPSKPALPHAAPRAAHKEKVDGRATHVLALSGTTFTEADARVLAELQRSAIALGQEAGKVAVRVLAGEARRIAIGDSVRVHVNAEHAGAMRELASARLALGTSLRGLEVRPAEGSRTIKVVVPCPPAPPAPPAPPSTDCGARITIPAAATKPVGA